MSIVFITLKEPSAILTRKQIYSYFCVTTLSLLYSLIPDNKKLERQIGSLI